MNNEVELVRDAIESDIPTTILSLQQRFETVRQTEIARMRRRLGKLSVEQESAIDSMTRGIINRVLGGPVAILEVASTENDAAVLNEVVNRIFNLGVVTQGTPMTQKPDDDRGI